ncbi:enterochelin esterase-like enzyme [Streptacidiphilus sp. MAP12-33]|uniref:alpha/beta hydrolase n=1 Tax=Streptacidiphilus sp. MAP12-33 TaxID=3156266 RepID=UPI003513B638
MLSLTGTGLLWFLAALTVGAVAAATALWNRVHGPGLLRLLQRVLLIMVCQATAIALVAAWINNSYGLYASWSDLLGSPGGGTVAMPGPPPGRAAFTRASDGTLQTYVRGRASRLSGQVIVWTPPQYDQSAYRHTAFPVMMLLHGVPGSPSSWIEGGGMPQALAAMMADGTVRPAIVVIPVIDPAGVDTTCSDVRGHANATWLADDVPTLVRAHFRTLPAPHGWGHAGLSTGGLCAVKLAMQYPHTFTAAAAMDPDPFTGDPTALPDPLARQHNSPLWLAGQKPDVSLLLATSAQDSFSPVGNLVALQDAVQPPTTVAPLLILAQGGHNWGTWQRMYPTVFPWLSRQLTPPS